MVGRVSQNKMSGKEGEMISNDAHNTNTKGTLTIGIGHLIWVIVHSGFWWQFYCKCVSKPKENIDDWQLKPKFWLFGKFVGFTHIWNHDKLHSIKNRFSIRNILYGNQKRNFRFAFHSFHLLCLRWHLTFQVDEYV